MNLDLVLRSCCKPGGVEDKNPTTESGFSAKIMERRYKLDGLEDKVSKIESEINAKNYAKTIKIKKFEKSGSEKKPFQI